jgi:hypothetical protein
MSTTTTGYEPSGDTFPAAPDQDLDLDVELDDDDELGQDAATEHDGDTSSGTRTATRTKTALNRALVRRVANKAAELTGAPKARKETLAAMLGCGTDLAELTYTVMTADRSALAPAADLNAIAAEDMFSASIVALSQGRARIRGVWSLLVTLGASVPEAIPASDAKAAIAVAKAIDKLPDGARDELSKVVALGRKS